MITNVYKVIDRQDRVQLWIDERKFVPTDVIQNTGIVPTTYEVLEVIETNQEVNPEFWRRYWKLIKELNY